jgi:hypothetical protein
MMVIFNWKYGNRSGHSKKAPIVPEVKIHLLIEPPSIEDSISATSLYMVHLYFNNPVHLDHLSPDLLQSCFSVCIPFNVIFFLLLVLFLQWKSNSIIT